MFPFYYTHTHTNMKTKMSFYYFYKRRHTAGNAVQRKLCYGWATVYCLRVFFFFLPSSLFSKQDTTTFELTLLNFYQTKASRGIVLMLYTVGAWLTCTVWRKKWRVVTSSANNRLHVSNKICSVQAGRPATGKAIQYMKFPGNPKKYNRCRSSFWSRPSLVTHTHARIFTTRLRNPVWLGVLKIAIRKHTV